MAGEPVHGAGAQAPGSSPMSWPAGETNMEFEEFSFSGDDLPEALEKILSSVIRRANDSGLAHDYVADDIMPSKEQLVIGPGDLVAVTHSAGDNADNEFTIAEIVNPEQHAETFPDWEDRLLKSYVLGKWYTPVMQEGRVGWLPRAKLVKFPKELWDQMLGWVHGENIGEHPPAWLIKRYNEALSGLAEANPGKMADPIHCHKCGSFAIVVKMYHEETRTYCVGNIPEEKGKPAEECTELRVVSPYGKEGEVKCWTECLDCGVHIDLPDEIALMG